ncbi:hypothetical protein J7348_11785 [Qipengyuania flava]|uniref:hypothetical protein n=1 Tax=Qipengyuania flava TaxID=192812 RepID=UPI001ADD3866|nr:hypothetical protein [Qipengyuania flava]MBO9505302.1 hypothetical protein [Qipengyuania flava]
MIFLDGLFSKRTHCRFFELSQSVTIAESQSLADWGVGLGSTWGPICPRHTAVDPPTFTHQTEQQYLYAQQKSPPFPAGFFKP